VTTLEYRYRFKPVVNGLGYAAMVFLWLHVTLIGWLAPLFSPNVLIAASVALSLLLAHCLFREHAGKNTT
jgi:hypothetical protein